MRDLSLPEGSASGWQLWFCAGARELRCGGWAGSEDVTFRFSVCVCVCEDQSRAPGAPEKILAPEAVGLVCVDSLAGGNPRSPRRVCLEGPVRGLQCIQSGGPVITLRHFCIPKRNLTPVSGRSSSSPNASRLPAAVAPLGLCRRAHSGHAASRLHAVWPCQRLAPSVAEKMALWGAQTPFVYLSCPVSGHLGRLSLLGVTNVSIHVQPLVRKWHSFPAGVTGTAGSRDGYV